jgi:hypothetical protein
MSTTWVFLGLLAGREIAISLVAGLRGKAEAMKDVASDALRAGAGLVVSVSMALLLPFFANGEFPDLGQALFGGDETAAIEQPSDGGHNGLGR